MPFPPSSRTRVAGAGTAALRRRLEEAPGPGEVVHAGTQAIYVRLGDRVVGVAARGAVHVPATIATALPRLPDVEVGASAEVVDAMLCVAGLTVGVDRLVASDVPRLPAEAAARLAAVLTPAGPDLSPARDQLPAEALDGLARGEATAVVRLLGRGDGLTPVGDDVVSGWLVAARAADRGTTAVGAAALEHAHRTTALSATLLADAVEGGCIPEFRALLLALASGRDVAAAVDRLVAVGHTSGTGMLLGAHLALRP